MEAMLLLYEAKADSHSISNIREERQEIEFEINRLSQLKDQARSILATHGLTIEPQVTINWNYDAKDESQLSVKEGQTVKLLDSSDADWWLVESNGKRGFVPNNYCHPILYRAQVLWDYTANGPSELTVHAGIEVEAFPSTESLEWVTVKDKA
eukprot:CAMPEP_0168576992 /NCGR_PEP_ID=MMETSP0413-20121227/20546_1 /TAXON_ID=136452 /ORGANISM="Filamoeba nolandi, Strain NC-AS-23-1" /LENGTH=152 /DNA_ID=CAMNT_0008610711 /DNA_START=363 /DNA_END=818 /DNA_ORIENTATION=-